jgi:PilZ domain
MVALDECGGGMAPLARGDSDETRSANRPGISDRSMRRTREYIQKRTVKRCALVASAEVTDLGSDAKLSARTSEVGLGGCYVDALNPFPDGTLVAVRILRDQGVFEAKGKVVYCHPSSGMGVAFTEMAPAQRLLLEDWLAEIVSQLKPVS